MSSSVAIKIKKLQQKDNFTFTIEWSDGQINDFRLCDLQKNCPCANCNDEVTGKSKDNRKTLDENVCAQRIVSIGRYALKVYFTSGCSTGIFDFEFLRRLSKQSNTQSDS